MVQANIVCYERSMYDTDCRGYSNRDGHCRYCQWGRVGKGLIGDVAGDGDGGCGGEGVYWGL
jgi:hypothetical protein